MPVTARKLPEKFLVAFSLAGEQRDFTVVLNTDKNSDPYCKQGIYDAETGALRLRSRVLS